MFVYSLKGKSIKLVGLGLLLCAATVICLSALPDYDNGGTVYVSSVTDEPISFSNIKTESDRLSLIEKLGFEVENEVVEEYNTRIPKEFDSVYLDYNRLQLAQGFDLSEYRGKKVTRYTYRVLNYPNKSESEKYENVYLNLIFRKNRVIGGDLSSSEHGGFVRTFCDFAK